MPKLLLCSVRESAFNSLKMEIVKREDIKVQDYIEIFEKEKHHNHEIIRDDNGTLRWKENEVVESYRKNISLNDLCPLLTELGYGKNSEIYRKLYRNMGYSLSGYWEVFYWEMNNDDADDYVAQAVP